MKIAPVALAVPVYILILLPASADDALDPRNASAGVGVEVSSFNRDINFAGLDIGADGPMVGVHGHFKSGTFLRGDLRAATGNVDVGANNVETNEDMDFAEARGTLGMELNEGRLYTGLGVTYYRSEFFGIDWNTTSAYVPFGYVKSNSVSKNWSARTRFEGRVAIAGEEEMEGLPVFGDVTFDHGIGVGARIEFAFRNKNSGLQLGVFVENLQPGDTEDEFGIEVEDINNTSAGIAAGVSF